MYNFLYNRADGNTAITQVHSYAQSFTRIYYMSLGEEHINNKFKYLDKKKFSGYKLRSRGVKN